MRAEHNLQSISYTVHKSLYHKSLFSQITSLCQILHKETNTTHHTSYLVEHINLFRKDKIIATISERKHRKSKTHVLEPIHILQALNTETYIHCL